MCSCRKTTNILFIIHLDGRPVEDDLHTLLESYGDCMIHLQCNYAFARFETDEKASRAKEAIEYHLRHDKIKVEYVMIHTGDPCKYERNRMRREAGKSFVEA